MRERHKCKIKSIRRRGVSRLNQVLSRQPKMHVIDRKSFHIHHYSVRVFRAYGPEASWEEEHNPAGTAGSLSLVTIVQTNRALAWNMLCSRAPDTCKLLPLPCGSDASHRSGIFRRMVEALPRLTTRTFYAYSHDQKILRAKLNFTYARQRTPSACFGHGPLLLEVDAHHMKPEKSSTIL